MRRLLKSEAIERLQEVLDKVPELQDSSYGSPEFAKWHRNSRVALERVFGADNSNIHEFLSVPFQLPYSAPTDDYFLSESERRQELFNYEMQVRLAFKKGLGLATALLESMIEEIEKDWSGEDRARNSDGLPRGDVTHDSKVFLVHGRDHGTRDTVARFLESLKLRPVILEEQADKGRTIIAKFEEEAREVRYVVVLLTPDDEGRLGDSGVEYSPRARQNVIFEFGYFAGTLGRRHVCALVKGDIEKPSDYDGVVYIPYDSSGGWKLGLVRELKAAGLDVDANLAV